MPRKRKPPHKVKPRRPYGAAALREWAKFMGGDEAVRKVEEWQRKRPKKKPEQGEFLLPP